MYFSQSLGAARAIRGDVGGDPDVVGEGGNEVEETVPAESSPHKTPSDAN